MGGGENRGCTPDGECYSGDVPERPNRLGEDPGAVNFGDPVERTVGRRTAPRDTLDPSRDTREAARAWRRAFRTPFVARGVFRFGSFEEANEWTWRTISRRTGD
jgi:hypothetical protein